jgi:2,4-dienoyl-CoA reductase-like NADH-dependent reductase (Old Yellow Enzyme family)
MAEPYKLVRVPSLKTVADFRQHVASLGVEIPCEDTIATGAESPLAQPLTTTRINGKTIGNRIAVQPMEGWDAETDGQPTAHVFRRWMRFGESGGKLIFGGEAMAVRPDGRANPNQLIINSDTEAGLTKLRAALVRRHEELYDTSKDLVIGFQLTHSGRFCKPLDKRKMEPRVAYRHPILDRKFGITSDSQVFTDGEIDQLIQDYVAAARIAWNTGADFVDIKHCHGYLLHEFLSAHTRPGKFGGSFENRTRPLREIVAGIRASGNPIDLAVRVSAFDFVPFRPDPALSSPGKPGPGIPEDFSHCLPYRYGFGVNPNNPVEYDLTETHQFVALCADLGIKIVNLTAGSPYYNPHIQRPAAYPPSDGYRPAHDPLIDVARQLKAAHEIRRRAPASLVVMGSAYSYLQEFLPQVGQYLVRHGWSDTIGVGRAVLSYPAMLWDAVTKGVLATRFVCRTFSDCTTAPRNGMVSGCYPLDGYYAELPEYDQLKALKK